MSFYGYNPADYKADFSWIGESANVLASLAGKFPELIELDKDIKFNRENKARSYDAVTRMVNSLDPQQISAVSKYMNVDGNDPEDLKKGMISSIPRFDASEKETNEVYMKKLMDTHVKPFITALDKAGIPIEDVSAKADMLSPEENYKMVSGLLSGTGSKLPSMVFQMDDYKRIQAQKEFEAKEQARAEIQRKTAKTQRGEINQEEAQTASSVAYFLDLDVPENAKKNLTTRAVIEKYRQKSQNERTNAANKIRTDIANIKKASDNKEKLKKEKREYFKDVVDNTRGEIKYYTTKLDNLGKGNHGAKEQETLKKVYQGKIDELNDKITMLNTLRYKEIESMEEPLEAWLNNSFNEYLKQSAQGAPSQEAIQETVSENKGLFGNPNISNAVKELQKDYSNVASLRKNEQTGTYVALDAEGNVLEHVTPQEIVNASKRGWSSTTTTTGSGTTSSNSIRPTEDVNIQLRKLEATESNLEKVTNPEVMNKALSKLKAEMNQVNDSTLKAKYQEIISKFEKGNQQDSLRTSGPTSM